MKKNLIISSLLIFFFTFMTAQEEEKKNKTHFAVKTIQNSVAGFSPLFVGSFETNKNFDITFYGLFWTNPSFGNLQAGSDQLLETGAGLGFKLSDNKLYLNPGLGFAHGKFFSDVPGTLIGEAIIPNTFVAYNNSVFDFEGYVAYYKSLRDRSDISTRDLFLLWAAPGIQVSKRIVLGGFFEELAFMNFEDEAEGVKNLQVYRFLGGSIKLKLDNGIAFRFSAGANLVTDVGASDEFYKVSAFVPLQ
ncbi:hypothetical protein NBT05_00080 [Aquimarina sp. ERC-38]|uniref:DUF6733 family protein n=1 Tax=Aquimarina sp. ERC-38 TaxID=2949996 RepID=UPI0022486B89|nr:DUF6733 family protein [Aquimarina sp. ERC-38]UZO80900.1 hypothetical protein NBT05_00080 [Aquimarina sp. ERC-38]